MSMHVQMFYSNDARKFYNELAEIRNLHPALSKGDDFDAAEMKLAKELLVKRGIINEDYRIKSSNVLEDFMNRFYDKMIDVEAKPVITREGYNWYLKGPCVEYYARGVRILFDSKMENIATLDITEELSNPEACYEMPY